MFRTLFRSMLAHRLRLALTALAIALGVAFMSGSFVFTATLTHSLDALFAQASTGTDVAVLHSSPAGSTVGPGADTKPVPASILATVRQVPGVAETDGEISARAVLLGRDGKPLTTQFGLALSWPADTPFQAPYTRRTGRPPAGPGQVMIDRASARKGHFAVGDTIEVAVGGHALPFTVSGITGYGPADTIGGGSMAIFHVATAQRLFGKTGVFDRIDVKAAPGVPASQLRDRIAQVLPSGVVAITAATAASDAAQQINSQLGILTDFFLAFAGIALFVGAFVIWNTFSIMVGQRTRELALTRALGAGRGQVFRSVLAEAAIVATIASVIGVGLGLALSRGLAALLATFGFALPISGLVIPPAEMAIAIGTGIAMTLAASVAPAYRATRVAPVQAMREVAAEPVRFPARRLIGGSALTAASVASLLAGIFAGAGIVATAAGAAGCFIGVTVLAPLVTRPLAYAIGAPLTALPGRSGVLARGNTMRNPKRTSATAAALMVGLAVIVSTSVLVSSARATVTSQINVASRTDFYVQATNSDLGITPALAAIVAAQPGVTNVTEVRTTVATVGGTANANVDGVDPAAIGQFTDLGVTSGQLSGLNGNGMLVSAAAAAGHHWRVGDVVPVQFGSYGTSQLRLAGIFANIGPLSGYLLGNATFTADTGIRTDNVDLVRAPATASASARSAIQSALRSYPGAELLDQSGYIKNQTAMLNSLLTLVTALLVLAIVIALLGVVNTLALSVVERTREIGLLRAIGMRRGQVRQMVTAEAVIIAVIGAVLGTALGLGLGAALSDAVTQSQQATVSIPAGQLVTYIVATAAAGVLASVAPARRAAKLNMLAAITAE